MPTKEFFQYLQSLPPLVGITALFLATVFLVFLRWGSIMKLLKWPKNVGEYTKRTCGDCVLILFSIREKYEYETRKLDTNLLRMQMKFSEQKIQEIIFFLSQSFSDDIKVYGEGAEQDRKATQSALYCEALKNAMLSVKDELRRSFKENGFEGFSEVEFSYYVKDKTRTMLTIVRSYLNQYYVDGDKTIVHLKERFDRMDKENLQKFEDWAFQIFVNAKDLVNEFEGNKENNTSKLRSEIDEFVKNTNNTQNY